MQSIAQISLSDKEMIRNPYPIYDRLRRESPVHLDPVYGLYVITRAAELEKIVENPQDFSSMPDPSVMAIYSTDPEVVALYVDAGVYPPLNTLVTTDPPAHRRYRSLVEKAVGAASVKQLTVNATAIVEELIDAFIDRGEVEFVAEYSMKLPLFVLCRLLGVPRSLVSIMHELAASTTRLADGRTLDRAALISNHAIQVRGQLVFERYIDEVARDPRDTLLSHLVHASLDTGDRLTRREIHSVLQALLVGGNDTTPSGLSNVVLLLSRDAALQSRLRTDPTLISAFVEEAIRLESPVQSQYRRATRDLVLAGTSIPKESMITLRFGACNRDPDKFDRPNDLLLDRKGSRLHFAFGMGIHYCVGHMLARMEMNVTVARLLARVDRLQLNPPDFEPEYVDKLVVRNPETLPLRISKTRSLAESAAITHG